MAILFSVGLRVSEVLGLAWSDLDLDAGTATVRRAVVEVKGSGRMLGPPKTAGAVGEHRIAPHVVERLRRWRKVQAAERLAAGPLWAQPVYEGRGVDLVFTMPDGGLVARQAIDKVLRSTAERIGLDSTHLGTHVGRRTVVTALYASGEELADVARHVGHASPTTTAGYVASIGNRPQKTAAKAAQLLDVKAE